MNTKIRDLGDKIFTNEWSFNNKKIVSKFQQHINNSIPLYNEGHDIITQISKNILPNKSVVTDLGCSLGELIFKIYNSNIKKNIKYIGIDNSENMIKKALKLYSNDNFHFYNKDIFKYEIEKSDLIISYYTLQFIPIKRRIYILKKIHNSLNKNGVFIYFEKTTLRDKVFDKFNLDIYYNFKKKSGYTNKQILNKKTLLKGKMKPITSDKNIYNLKKSGFKKINLILKYSYFEGYICLK